MQAKTSSKHTHKHTNAAHVWTLCDQGHICLVFGACWPASICENSRASIANARPLRNNHGGNFRLHSVSDGTETSLACDEGGHCEGSWRGSWRPARLLSETLETIRRWGSRSALADQGYWSEAVWSLVWRWAAVGRSVGGCLHACRGADDEDGIHTSDPVRTLHAGTCPSVGCGACWGSSISPRVFLHF